MTVNLQQKSSICFNPGCTQLDAPPMRGKAYYQASGQWANLNKSVPSEENKINNTNMNADLYMVH